jgi:hypothetical protein
MHRRQWEDKIKMEPAVMKWTAVIWMGNRVEWWGLVNTVMNHLLAQKAENFLTT